MLTKAMVAAKFEKMRNIQGVKDLKNVYITGVFVELVINLNILLFDLFCFISCLNKSVVSTCLYATA